MPDRAEAPSPELLGQEWWIALEGWVLPDGNYTDFRTGEVRQFALSFDDLSLGPLRAGEPEAPFCRRREGTSSYGIRGRRTDPPETGATFLDFGLGAYCDNPWPDSPRSADGKWVSGEISLLVDDYSYMDYISRRSGAPPLIHTWTIDEIQVGVRRDASSNPTYRTIKRTHMSHDRGSYLLRCTLHDEPPVSTMERSGARAPYGPVRDRR